MYDFLDKIGLKAVLEAVKGKIPSSLPANGGNADTLAEKTLEEIKNTYGTNLLTSPETPTDLREWIYNFDSGIYVIKYNQTNLILPYNVSDGSNGQYFVIDWKRRYSNDLGGYTEHYGTLYFHSMEDNGVNCYCTVYNNIKHTEWKNVADGGNADTVDGYHADDFAKSTSPRITGDMRFLSDSTQNTITAIYSANDVLVLRNATKDWSSVCDVVIGSDGVRIANATQNFKVGDPPYVTGTVTVAANATTAITNHGFIPSAVLYSGLGGVQFATSATTTSFDLADGSALARTIKYIIFR